MTEIAMSVDGEDHRMSGFGRVLNDQIRVTSSSHHKNRALDGNGLAVLVPKLSGREFLSRFVAGHFTGLEDEADSADSNPIPHGQDRLANEAAVDIHM